MPSPCKSSKLGLPSFNSVLSVVQRAQVSKPSKDLMTWPQGDKLPSPCVCHTARSVVRCVLPQHSEGWNCQSKSSSGTQGLFPKVK